MEREREARETREREREREERERERRKREKREERERREKREKREEREEKRERREKRETERQRDGQRDRETKSESKGEEQPPKGENKTHTQSFWINRGSQPTKAGLDVWKLHLKAAAKLMGAHLIKKIASRGTANNVYGRGLPMSFKNCLSGSDRDPEKKRNKNETSMCSSKTLTRMFCLFSRKMEGTRLWIGVRRCLRHLFVHGIVSGLAWALRSPQRLTSGPVKR